MNKNQFWIIIPALNAERTLPKVLRDIKALYPEAQVVVIDDGSEDQTSEFALKCGAILVSSALNQGYGASVKKGVAYALDQGATRFLTMGADDQRDVRDILVLWKTFEEGGYDVVVGSKLLTREKIPFMRKIANILLAKAFNLIYGTKICDLTSGFKVFNVKVGGQLFDLEDDYAFDAALRSRIAKRHLKSIEVPVRVYYHAESTRMRNPYAIALRILWVFTKRRFY